MRANQAEHAVATMCPGSGARYASSLGAGCLPQRIPLASQARPRYDAWRGRGRSHRAKRDDVVRGTIGTIHQQSRGPYGVPRVHAELVAGGCRVSRKRVARLMREVGLAGVSRRRGTRTTRVDASHRGAPDRIERQCQADAPDRIWVADITYVPTWAGFVFLAIVLDVFSRRVVGWAMATHLRTEIKFRLLRKLARCSRR